MSKKRPFLHTPGPWVYDASLPENVYSDDATGSIVATCGGFDFAPRSKAEIYANARLIAEAPALLDIARSMDARLTEFWPGGPDECQLAIFRPDDNIAKIWRDIRAALAAVDRED